jgi:membrane protease subunit HflC
MKNLTNILVATIVAILLFTTSAFTVDQTQFVLVQRLGEIIAVKKEPGMHFKMPIVDNLKYFDNRILTLD